MRMLKNYHKWSAVKDKNITFDEDQLFTLFGEFPRFCPNIMKITNIADVVPLNIHDKFR